MFKALKLLIQGFKERPEFKSLFFQMLSVRLTIMLIGVLTGTLIVRYAAHGRISKVHIITTLVFIVLFSLYTALRDIAQQLRK